MSSFRFFALALLSASSLLAIDLDTVRAEPKPDKRYRLALDYGEEKLQSARDNIAKGNFEAYSADLEEVVVAVRLADDTLRGTGDDPSRKPKHFKRAELKIREFLRRLKSLDEQVGVDERPPVEKARGEIRTIHDNLVRDIVGRRD